MAGVARRTVTQCVEGPGFGEVAGSGDAFGLEVFSGFGEALGSGLTG